MDTIEQQVREASGPAEALLAIARGLDTLLLKQPIEMPPDPWAGLGAWKEPPPAGKAFTGSAPLTVTETDDLITVDIAPVDEDRRAKRRELAEQLGMDDEWGPSDPPWVEVYMKGGPLWLYNSVRDFVDGLPYEMKKAMVEDIQLDDPLMAQEVGRDLLKDKTSGRDNAPSIS